MFVKIGTILQSGLLLLSCITTFSQTTAPVQSTILKKEPISFENPKVWPVVVEGLLSDDGNYVVYKHYPGKGPNTLILQSTLNHWQHEFINGNNPVFANNGNFLIFKLGADTLAILDIIKDSLIQIPNISSFGVNEVGGDNWLCYFDKTMAGELFLKNLRNGKELQFSNLINYKVCDNGEGIIVQLHEQKGNKKKLSLNILNLEKETRKEIWSTENENLMIPGYSTQNGITFLVHDKSKLQNEIWYYNSLRDSSYLVITNSVLKDFAISMRQYPVFGENRRLIFFGIEANPPQKPKPDIPLVDVWSYHDELLQSIQLAEVKKKNVYTCSIDLESKKLLRLEYENDRIIERNKDFVIVKHELGNHTLFESNWNDKALYSFTLVDLASGDRRLLKDHLTNGHSRLGVSPHHKWVVYYDFKAKNFFSYELATGITRNITARCLTNWENEANDKPEPELNWVPWRNTWLANDSAVFIYDNYDVWLVDPGCNKSPVNITRGIGKVKKLKFELMREDVDIDISHGNTLFLKAENTITKENGFYAVQPGKARGPELCSMGPYVFGEFPPIKANNVEQYLVLRMSAVEAPNYFLTNDFKEFKRVTDIQPQKAVNWLKTELVKWKSPEDRVYSGVLYKPEDFNPNNKYPVIFDIYEKRSQDLNLFIYPEASTGRINIPSFVSNGYLVFTPDIYYKKGEPGRSALSAVVSAANYLTKFPWVDKQRMGIQGHSFGGYETNYIIAHTKMFAAACSASSMCDLVSFYGSAVRGGYSIWWSERNQGRLGGTIWDNQETYINNSPIFQAKNITTPLLMMNNKEDGTNPFLQGLEFFTSLRRLGKKVWMLQYDGQGHLLEPGPAAEDLHLRMFQFFNHYLKGMSEPKWMKAGIPAKYKGYENGF